MFAFAYFTGIFTSNKSFPLKSFPHETMEEIIPNLRDPLVKSRMKSLFAYSFLILSVPLGSMFLLKNFVFETIFGWQSRDSMLYSAIAAVVMVHVVLVVWIRATWDDGKSAEKMD